MQRFTSLLLIVAALGTGCGSDDGSDGQPVADYDAGDDTSCPPETPQFVTGPAGLTREDATAGIKVRLDWAQYQPPAKDYNTWDLAITDLAGSPLPQAQITWACAWMPAHGHGINPKAITRLPDGRFEISKQNLSMNGGWDVRFWVNATGTGPEYSGGTEQRNANACKAPGGTQQNIEFKICVPRQRGGS
jgi:hypothetical protein